MIAELEKAIKDCDGDVIIRRSDCGTIYACTIRKYSDRKSGPGLYAYSDNLHAAIRKSLASMPCFISHGRFTFKGVDND